MHFTQSSEIKNQDRFTELKTLNLIDVFGNMQFISQWKQTNDLEINEIEKFKDSIIGIRYLIIEYHAYLSYRLYTQLLK